MKNIVTLQKDENGHILCSQITAKGVEYIDDTVEENGFWEEGGTIALSELDEILDRDVAEYEEE